MTLIDVYKSVLQTRFGFWGWLVDCKLVHFMENYYENSSWRCFLYESQQTSDYFHSARRQALSVNHLFIPVAIVVS